MASDSQYNSHDQELDNRLAEFADRAIAGTLEQLSTAKPVETEENNMSQESEEAEIEALQETILRFYSAVKAARPDPAAAARIDARVKTEWKQPTQDWWKIWLGTFQSGFKFQAALAVATGMIVLLAVSLIKPDATTLTGTASGFPTWALFLFILAVIVIFILFKKDRP